MMHTHKPRIAFFGTPQFAVPTLEALARESRPTLVITAPDDLQKGPSPVQRVAKQLDIRIDAPEILSPDVFRGQDFDLFIVAAYGKILKKDVLDIPKLGTLNVHPSLLPKYRGASPIQAALLAGETETGVTIMRIDSEIDHGPIIAQEHILIEPHDTSISLTQKLAKQGAHLLIKTLPRYLDDSIIPVAQDHSRATFTKLLKKNDGNIDWNSDAEYIERHIRAYLLWPSSWTEWHALRIKILRAHIENKVPRVPPGTFLHVIRDNTLAVATKNKLLILETLQPAGKEPMTGQEFINGHRAKLTPLSD